jgi:hypothetical protein
MTPHFETRCVTPRLHRNHVTTVHKPSTSVHAPDTRRHAARGRSAQPISPISAAPVSASSATRRPGVSDQGWRLGLVTDRDGRVHLGVVVADAHDGGEPRFIELLAPVGASQITESDVARMMVFVRGDQLASLRRIVDQCVDDNRLRSRLLELMAHSAAQLETSIWPG